MYWLITLAESVWMAIADAAATPWKEIRFACIAGARISFHTFYPRVLEPTVDLLWWLTRGDRLANLDEPKQSDMPEEPTSKQRWIRLRGCASDNKLTSVLKLLWECSWATMMTEH